MAGLYLDGRAALGEKAAEVHWVDVLGAANALRVLLWAAFAGTVAAVLGTVRVLTLGGALEAWQEGAKSMLPALLILLLAWVLGGLCKELDTAGTVARWTSGCSPAFVPVSTFALAGFIAFITGTSWGTMAILFPIAVPIGSAGGEPVLLATIGAVLAGSTFGDHCSPISDTTILSSTGSACDHMDHVRTQMPYALAAGAFSALLCYLPAGFGWSPWLCTALGLAGLTAYAWLRGRPV
jgi:Na+/H+ antiporter NhaC